MYGGGNPMVEFLRMGWRRRADLHQNEDWRGRVSDFLMGEEGAAEIRGGSTEDAGVSSSVWIEDGIARQVVNIGRSRAVLVERTFDRERDGCYSTSYEDYSRNVCWICQDENPQWDLWLSCRHLFCAKCSTQMLQRRMPCPLCRVASSTVLRGRSIYVPPDRRGLLHAPETPSSTSQALEPQPADEATAPSSPLSWTPATQAVDAAALFSGAGERQRRQAPPAPHVAPIGPGSSSRSSGAAAAAKSPPPAPPRNLTESPRPQQQQGQQAPQGGGSSSSSSREQR
mmetsp:Transcript_33744/g.85498  ORF Transcript_33744/g.85498 Transcript_33744/m.85498 type:complete len:284 (-) Transcript_33744:3-854(-)